MSDPDRRQAAHSRAQSHAHGHEGHGHGAHAHAHAHGHGDSAHDTHDDGHHGEPAEETLAADEQPTPLWLTVLGAGLFLVAFILIAAF